MADIFCDESNIASSLKFISSELEILGFPEICYEEESHKQALIELINITWTVISEFKRVAVKENERTIEIAKLKSQINSQLLDIKRLEKSLEKERQTSLNIKESLASSLSLKKELEIKIRQSRTEINNLKKSFEILNLQHGNDILNKENIIANLKVKLIRLVNDGNIDLEEKLELPQLSQLTKHNSKLEKYICSLINNIQMLILENANIRNLILKIYMDISRKFKSSKTDVREITQLLLNLPGVDFIELLEQELQSILKEIKF